MDLGNIGGSSLPSLPSNKNNTVRTFPMLSKFFIFCPKDLPEGQEHKKILFFYPKEFPIEEQTKFIGLSEAFVNFTGKFSPNQPCEAVHYEKHTSTFFSTRTRILDSYVCQ